jgi:hypothetical protein
LSFAVLALPAENSKGGLVHKALLIASARAADDEGIRCKMGDFLISCYKFELYTINIRCFNPYFLGKKQAKAFHHRRRFLGRLAAGSWLASKSLNYIDRF